MNRIAPCLWFNDQAEEAAKFYTSVFKQGKILEITHYPNAGQEIHGKSAGSVMTVVFELDGTRITALNGGPQFKFTEAISLMIDCKTQDEIDYYWEKLIAGGGKHGPCGWLTDRFGLSWQISSAEFDSLIGKADPARSARVFGAMMKMSKIDLGALKRAYDGE